MILKKILRRIYRILVKIKEYVIIFCFKCKILYKSRIEIYKMRTYLAKWNITNVKTLDCKAWHTDFYYFTGSQYGKKLYIKCSPDHLRIAHELKIIQKLGCIKDLEGRYPKLIQHIKGDKYSFLIEEFYEYPSLATLIEKNLLLESDKKIIFSQFIYFIDTFKDNYFIHADVRPENFFYQNGMLYMIDFGFSFFTSTEGDYFSFIERKDRQYLFSAINKKYRLQEKYFDDAYSFLKICKYIDSSFFTKYHEIWTDLVMRCDVFYYQEVR